MWDFDGYSWRAGASPRASNQASSDTPISYTITLEPHGKHWLLALDLPARIPPQSVMTGDYELRSIAPVTTRLRYDMVSYLNYHDKAPLNDFDRRRALRLPHGSNPRTADFALKLRATVGDDRGYIEAVLRMFRTEHFFYTTQPPPLQNNSVDEFLFSTRAGFCEHYASSFVVLMRDAGIPARVVTGYQGGELNDFGDYLIVRQSDAHAWAEVWLANTGWTRIDPTAAVSPTRIEQGMAAAVPQGAPLPLLLQSRYAWLRQMRLTWDSAANAWNQLVLGYDLERQRRFLREFGVDATWQKLGALILVTTGALMLLLTLWILSRLRSPRANIAVAAYARFCARLARRGSIRRSSEGPEAFRQRTIELHPEWAHAINTISRLYIRLRYGKAVRREDELRLKHAVSRFRP
jgi:transglutaminase-like putative cysteine protease